MTRTALALLLTLLFGLATGPQALAKEEKKKDERRNFAVSEWVYKRLSESHALLEEEKYAEAMKPLEEIEERKRTSAHERALMWQTRGYIHSSQGSYGKAISDFEQCLAEDALPETARLSTLYNIGQLYLSVDRFGEAAKTLEGWLTQVENPSADAYYLLAVAHMQNGAVSKARPHARQAIRRAGKPVERSLQLLLAIEFELKNYEQLARVLEHLVTYFPKKAYFMQLSAIYAQLGRESRALALLELAYTQGFLDRESELLNLAQRYLHRDVPYRAARLLAKGLKEGTIAGTKENWELLGNAWLQARENDEVIGPLQRAAELAGDGDLFVRLAQVHLERDDAAAALRALGKALEKGKLADPGKAHLLRGIAYAGVKQFAQARAALAEAEKYEESRDRARQWQAHVAGQMASAEP